jgi:hypothetical protein
VHAGQELLARRTKIWRNRSSLESKNEYTDPTENSASSATSFSVVSWNPLRPNTSSAAVQELGATTSWDSWRRISRRPGTGVEVVSAIAAPYRLPRR